MDHKVNDINIYYSHSRTLYNTDLEQIERDFLSEYGSVFCPNRDIKQCENPSMACFKIDECDVVVVSLDGDKITDGVFHEIKRAHRLNIPVGIIIEGLIISVDSVKTLANKRIVLDPEFQILL